MVSAQTAQATPKPNAVKRAKHKKSLLPKKPSVSQPLETEEAPLNPKFELNLYVSHSIFLGQNDKTLWPVGITGGIWAGYFLDPRALIGMRMDYSYSGGDAPSFADLYLPNNNQSASLGNGSGDMNVIRFIPSMKMNLNPSETSAVQPYVIFGAGILNKSMTSGTVKGSNGASASIMGYSITNPVVSLAVGLPIQLPYGYKVPLEFELSSGFTSPQSTWIQNLSVGLGRDW